MWPLFVVKARCIIAIGGEIASFLLNCMGFDTFADYFFAVLHIRILEAATEGGRRANVIREVGVDQANGTSDRRIVRQVLCLFDQPFAVQGAHMCFVCFTATASFIGLHRISLSDWLKATSF